MELISLFEGNKDPLSPDDLIKMAQGFLKECPTTNLATPQEAPDLRDPLAIQDFIERHGIDEHRVTRQVLPVVLTSEQITQR
jgi:hypothetical protein